MLQRFIRFPEFPEFLFHLGKTALVKISHAFPFFNRNMNNSIILELYVVAYF